MIKLSSWCKKNGIKYLTGYRWFKNNKMPVHAIQTETGTILVEDKAPEMVIPTAIAEPNITESSSAVSQVIQKTVEISKNGAPVEDLASFVINNFKLVQQGPITYSTNSICSSSNYTYDSYSAPLTASYNSNVSYDEAKLLYSSISTTNETDPITAENQIQNICKLDQNTFQMLLLATKR